MKNNNIMLDLETMGNGSHAALKGSDPLASLNWHLKAKLGKDEARQVMV